MPRREKQHAEHSGFQRSDTSWNPEAQRE